jgi:hypothetical protein
MAIQSGEVRYFRWPYQAKVMKIFEMVSRIMVFITGSDSDDLSTYWTRI